MNPRWKLTKNNINIEAGIFEEVVTYFDGWLEQRSVVIARENIKESEVDKYVISLITYNNMKTLVRDFVSYAHCIVDIDGAYILVLHSNQSSLEYFFSRVRFMGKDTTNKYAGGVL